MGEHIKRKRLALGLLQKDVGKQLGVTPETVLNWEKGYTEPVTRHLPGIISFLGYSPLPPVSLSVSKQLKQRRRELGLPQ